MQTLIFETARVFAPLLAPARYKGAYGGRGSGKSHFFAELLIEDHLRQPGLRSVCIREVQKTLKESSKRLLEDKLAAYALDTRHGFNEAQKIEHSGTITSIERRIVDMTVSQSHRP